MTDVKTVNTSDADIVGAFSAPEVTAAVAWNPQLSTMKATPGAKLVFSSADIPGEILDLLVVDTATLKANPNLGKALAGIWYETMALMQKQDAEGKAARAAMAKLAGTTPEVFDGQLATTFLYADPKGAWRRPRPPRSITTMTRVRDFSFAQGLFGQGATVGRRDRHRRSRATRRLGDASNDHPAASIATLHADGGRRWALSGLEA